MKTHTIDSHISDLIQKALIEDIQDGDYSSLACIPSSARGKCHLLVKENGILAGMEVARAVFYAVDKHLEFEPLLKDGDVIKKGDIAFYVGGSKQSLLKAERLALNFMQRMSGIATNTHRYSLLIKHTNTKLLDTRKTTPNNRIFEKLAVKIGGGYNHRFGLYDMIMLKDNHIDFAGGIKEAISLTNQYLKSLKKDLKIEIEVRDLFELDEVLAVGNVDRIMLDNFSIEDTNVALNKINGRFETESSGGIDEATIVSYAETGVDYISVGALTHQIACLDLSLKAL